MNWELPLFKICFHQSDFMLILLKREKRQITFHEMQTEKSQQPVHEVEFEKNRTDKSSLIFRINEMKVIPVL